MHKLRVEVTKFTLVGAANFVLTFLVFTLMLKVLRQNYLLSLVTSWAIGLAFSYALNFLWVFKPESELQFRSRFLKFLAAGVFSISLNVVILALVVEHTGFDPFLVQWGIFPFIVAINFLTAKFWSLRASGKAPRSEVPS